MKPGAVAAPGGTVAFSWEHEPGVSKQSPTGAEKPPDGKTAAGTKKAVAQPHRLRVPPPPGGPGAAAVSPPARCRRRTRGVRPEDDPFLAAYLAITSNGRNGGRREHTGAHKLLGWAGLGLAFGLSCKSACGVVEESVVRLPKIPEMDDC